MYKVAEVKVKANEVLKVLETLDSSGTPHKVRSSSLAKKSLFRNDDNEFFLGDHADNVVRVSENKAERLVSAMYSEKKWKGGAISIRKFLMSNIMN